MSFEWDEQDTGSRPDDEPSSGKHIGVPLRCPREEAARMTGRYALPHIYTLLASSQRLHEEHTEKDFRYPEDWDTKWWKRPRVFDLATDSLSPYAIYETIGHYRVVDPDWTIEPVVETWRRIGQLTDIAQFSPQDKIDLCEQELQFSAILFGREEAKQDGQWEADRQFLKKHLENCQELYSHMSMEYKKIQESCARVEADDIREFWQHLGRNKPETSFEVMNAFRLDLGRFTFWKQVIARSAVLSNVIMQINSRFNHLMRIGRLCQDDKVGTIRRFVSVSPGRHRSLPDATILRHWAYRAKLRHRFSSFPSSKRTS